MTACAVSVLAAAATPATARQAAPAPVAFTIQTQPLDAALIQFARVADVQVLYAPDLVRGKQANRVSGMLSPANALRQLVRGSGLTVVETNARTLTLERQSSSQQAVATVLDDVIVTAQRREESIARTPVAVTAVSGDRLRRSGLSSISALENLTPSLTLNQGGQAATGGFRIRGIGTETFSAGVEPAVATIVDGVLVGRTTNVTGLQLIDVERIEVLRGPQGTLFGKNASSGVVNIITREPTDTIEAGADLRVAERNEYGLTAYVSGPLSEAWAFRLTAFATGYDGHIKNTVPNAAAPWAPLLATQPNLLNGIDLYNDDTFYNLSAAGIRAKLRYEGETLTSQLALEYAQSESDCCARTFIEFFAPGAGLDRRIGGATIGRESDQTAADAPYTGTDENFSAIWTNTLRLPSGHEVVSVSGYRNLKNETIEDQDYGTGPELGLPAFFDKAEFDFRQSRTEQLSQETRLNSPLDEPGPFGGTYDYVVGGYLFNQVDDFGPGNRRINIINNTSPTRIAGCTTPVCRRDFVYQTTIESFNAAAFGQINLHLTEAWTVFYGGRYTYDHISYDWTSRDDPFAPFRQGTFDRKETASETNYSSRVGIEYQSTPNAFFYASFAQGYKGPGFRTFERIGSEEKLNPEHADAYEIGGRFRLPSKATFIGVTLYRQDYRDLVVSGFDQTLRITRNFNAAEARAQGVEIDFTSTPADGLTFAGGLAYSDNEYLNFPGTSCYPFQTAAQGCVLNTIANRNLQNLAGAPLQRAPEFKGNLSVRYEFPLTSEVTPFFEGDYRWFSEQQYGGNNDPKTLQDAYGVLDLGGGLRTPDGRIEAKVFVKNALDEFYAANIFSTDNWLNQRLPRDYRRYVGASLSLRY